MPKFRPLGWFGSLANALPSCFIAVRASRAEARFTSLRYAPKSYDMDRQNLLDLFRKMASEVAEKDLQGLEEPSVIADIGVDSLAMLEIVGEMERELEVQIPDDELVGIQTVAQLLDLVEKRVAAA